MHAESNPSELKLLEILFVFYLYVLQFSYGLISGVQILYLKNIFADIHVGFLVMYAKFQYDPACRFVI